MKNKKFIPLLFILLLSIIPLFDLFHPGLPLTHDGQDHVARIANFYQNLSEGVWVPRWAANLNWGYGHPILMFLYPTSSYVASLFHFLGFSFVDSLKIVFGLGFILSGISMYFFARNFFANNILGILVAVIYMFTPYRFVDLYVRGAIGEHVAFIFPPLVLYFLHKLSKKYHFLYLTGASLSLAGLILSHNAISLMFLPIIFLYICYLLWQSNFNKNLIFEFFLSIFLGFVFAGFFWIPAFFEGRYTLRDIVTKGEYLNRFVNPLALLYGQWNYDGSGRFSVQIGIINIIALISSLFSLNYFFRKKDKIYSFIMGIILYSLFTVFIMLPQSNFIWQKIMILQNFQFPWRFLSVLVFTSSVFAGFFVNLFPAKIKPYFCIFLIVFALFLSKDYWHAQTYLYLNDDYYSKVYNGTTDTGESGPIWSVRFMEKQPKAKIEVIDGEAKIEEISRKFVEHNYLINAIKETRIRENTLYFPGWNVLVDGKPVDIQFQDQNNRGLITFYVPKGEHNVKIIFKDTKLRRISNLITLGGIIFLIVLIIFYRPKTVKNKKYG